MNSKKHIVIWAVVGIGVPLFWGGVSFFFFNARESLWTDLYWYAVYVTCPSWLLPENQYSWLVTPALNGLLYACLALLISTLQQKKFKTR